MDSNDKSEQEQFLLPLVSLSPRRASTGARPTFEKRNTVRVAYALCSAKFQSLPVKCDDRPAHTIKV